MLNKILFFENLSLPLHPKTTCECLLWAMIVKKTYFVCHLVIIGGRNQISGKKKFSLKSAQKYAETFGYNLEFLLFGKGELNGCPTNVNSKDVATTVHVPNEVPASISVKQLKQIHNLLRVLNNNDACNAFDAVLAGDESKYKSLYEKLRRDFGWDISLAAVDKEYLDRIRRVLSDVQESRSKILASYIDDVMTSGGFYHIQTLMDSCKDDILRLQQEYPEYIKGDLD